MAYPLQRNQQNAITREDGLAYTWDPASGGYVNGKGLTFEQQHPQSAPTPQQDLGTVVIPGGNPNAPIDPNTGGTIGTPPVPPPPSVGWGQTPVQTGYGWGTGFTGSHAGATSPFADLTGTQQAYYTQHPDQANTLLRQWLAPNPTSPYAQFINARQPDMYTQFAAASTQPGQAGLQYTDWLKQNFGQISDQFAGQSQTQRGENPTSFGGGFAGRKTFA